MDQFRYFDLRQEGGACVARMKDEVLTGDATAEIIRAELNHVVSQYHPARLVIDLSDARILSSAVIGSMLRVRQKLVEQGGQMVLCCLSVPIRDVYRTLNLEGTMFQIFDTLEQALRAPLAGYEDRSQTRED